jgi:hypothetical protein
VESLAGSGRIAVLSAAGMMSLTEPVVYSDTWADERPRHIALHQHMIYPVEQASGITAGGDVGLTNGGAN